MPQPTISPPTSDAASEADIVSSTVFTPQSSSVASLAGGLSPDADEAIPSIEGGVYGRNSVTPPVAIDPPASRPRNSATPEVDALLNVRDLRLSDTTSPSPGSDPLDLSDLGAALVTGSPSPGLYLHPQHAASSSPGTPSPATPRRNRRSSSRVNQTPHSVRDEEPPVDRFHDLGFQSAFNEARELMGSLARVLGSSDVHLEPDSTMRDLYHTAQRLAAFRCPPTRVVGLVGDSGVGTPSSALHLGPTMC